MNWNVQPFRTALSAAFLIATSCAFGDTVTVDGKSSGPDRFANLTSALASLNRQDGVADVIQVDAALVDQPNGVVIEFAGKAEDPLSIVGSIANGSSPVIMLGDDVKDYAIDILGNSAARLTLRNLTLVPKYTSGGSALGKDYAHGGVRVRFAGDSTSKTGAEVVLENITVTSSLESNSAANPARRLTPYQPHRRWNHKDETSFASFCVEGASAAKGRVTFTGCQSAHTGHAGFILRHGEGVKVELNQCAARFGLSSGFIAERCEGAVAMRDCESAWNGGLGFMFSSGAGTLDLSDCRFVRNVGRGLQLGATSRDTIPAALNIHGGSFSENGWTDYNLSAAGKFEYGILVWGASPTVVDIAGTPDAPVLFLENFCRGLRIDNAQARLRRIEHAVFSGRHQQQALDLVDMDLSLAPQIRHCAFMASAYQSHYHSQVTLSDPNSAPAEIAFENCTFYNVAGKGYHHVAVENFGSQPTENVTLKFTGSIFAGGPAGQGADEKALYMDSSKCTAEFRNCAFVAEGPYALNSKYVELNVSGEHGNRVSETDCIKADPNFSPSRATVRDAKHYAASGEFLQPRSQAYVAANIGGFNLRAGAPAAPVQPIRVAIYTDQGPDKVDIFQTVRILQSCSDVTFAEIKARDIWEGCLENFDVIMFPGGSSAAESRSLKAKGREYVERFVNKGGGYIGTCAGAYLIMPSVNFPRVDFLDAKAVDYAHWARGHGIVDIKFTPEGQEILGSPSADAEIEYWQGPLMMPLETPGSRSFTPLATFASEIHDRGAPKGVMIGTMAAVAGQQGSGRYVAFSPHPEAVITPMFNGDYVYNAVLWASKRKGVTLEQDKKVP